MTAGQLERFARTHRQVSAAADQHAVAARRVSWRVEEDGSVALSMRLPAPDPAAGLADVLVTITGAYLAGKITTEGNADLYQVIVHVGTEALTTQAATDVPAETPGHPADSRRCHLDDGPALSPATVQRLACAASITWMLHDGTLLDVGRRHRTPPPALRRAVRERDHCRCQFPAATPAAPTSTTSAPGPRAAQHAGL
jgi:hypothetical protein